MSVCLSVSSLSVSVCVCVCVCVCVSLSLSLSVYIYRVVQWSPKFAYLVLIHAKLYNNLSTATPFFIRVQLLSGQPLYISGTFKSTVETQAENKT